MKKIVILILALASLYGCTLTQSDKDYETRRIADSIRVSDSLAMIQAEQQRISDSISQTGVWVIKYYVDEFGNPTDQAFITTSKLIYGTFSNSATEGSDLAVWFMINNAKAISIQLYEYAGNNPVKAGIEKGYQIRVKPPDSDAITLSAKNYSDRLRLNKIDSQKLSDILSKGGKIQFFIIDVTEYSHSTYKFDIENANGFDKILSELKQ